MKHFPRAIAVLLLIITSALPAAAAQWEGVFKGTIGKAAVIVELNAGYEKSDYKGGYREGSRYSYLPKARDINLILDAEGDNLRFTETLRLHRMFADEADKKITGTWEIRVDAKGATGTWTSPKGDKRLPIRLTRARNVTPENENANTLSSTYNALWLNELKLKDAGLFKTFGAIEVRKLKDSAFGLEHPILGAFPDQQRKRALNAKLEEAFRAEISQYRDCKNGVPVDWEDEGGAGPDIIFEVDYASPTLLSFTATGSVFCGGAHPENYVTPISFDVTTADHIGGRSGENQSDLNEDAFGRILKLASKDERIAFERFALGRWKEAAAKDKVNAENCMSGWNDEKPEGEKDFSLSFKPTGLAIMRRDYPSVAAACMFQDFNPTIIPWADLKPWIKPEQNLLTLD